MVSKMQRIFIIDHYLHSHHGTKMSNTLDGARAHTSEQTIEFLREFFTDKAPTKPGPNPIGFFPVGAFKK